MSLDLIAAKSPLCRLLNPRVTCAVTLTLVFLCGAAAGALAMSLGHSRLHRAAFWTDSGKSAYFERVKKDLDLTPTQAEQMESILDDFTQYYRTVLADGKSRIMQILNEDQRRKFEQILAGQQKR
jgi:hypothetical protein